MDNKIFEITQIDGNYLREHYEEYYALFSENTRGHEKDKEISEKYIMHKADEIFNYIETNSSIILGCIVENKIIGILWSYKRIFIEENRIYINSLIIDEKFRGLGIGKALMNEIEIIALKNNITTIDVSTSTFKKDAIRFYEDLGFISERIQFKKDLK